MNAHANASTNRCAAAFLKRAAALGALAAAGVMTLGACTNSGPLRRGARFEASWTGADTGHLAAPAAAEWCAAGRYLRIEALRGDTGVAVALFPADTVLRPGRYSLTADPADSMHATARPAAVVALRWFNALTIAGFRGDSGAVTLERGPSGRLSGELTVHGRLVGPRATAMRLAGRFRGLTVQPAARDCPVFLKPQRPDSGPAGAGVDSSDGDDLL